MKRTLFALILLPLTANASTESDYCELAGLATGANKEFVSSVAGELANRQDILGSPECDTVMENAIKRGKHLFSGKRSKERDEDLAKLLEFESEVLDAVIENMQPRK